MHPHSQIWQLMLAFSWDVIWAVSWNTLYMALACGLGFLTINDQVSRTSDPRQQSMYKAFFFFLSTQHFYDPVLDVSQYHFCCTQLVKAVTKVHPISRKRYINLITQWEEHNTTFQEPHVGWKILGSYL